MPSMNDLLNKAHTEIRSLKARNTELETEVCKLREQLTKHVNAINEHVIELESVNENLKEEIAELCWFYEPSEQQFDNAKKGLKKFTLERNIQTLEKLKLRAVEDAHKNWIVNPMNGVESPGVEALMSKRVYMTTELIDSEVIQLRGELDNE
ncbi:hypothetical protein [Shewanella sp.]|uniref:hypothetical protein n=1 Tax=Shewanella sp. TaxID=50422 RepID=UPI003567A33E